MATLWIREYGAYDHAPIAPEPGVDQTVTFTTSTQSTAFAGSTKYIGMISDAAFHYKVGANPTATTSVLKVPADTLIYIGVQAGDKIAAVTAA